MQATFLEETLNNLYQSSARSAEMLFAFSMLAIIISAFGLYSLAAFTAVRRTKEVGTHAYKVARTNPIHALRTE